VGLAAAFRFFHRVMHRSIPFQCVNPINLSESQIFSSERLIKALHLPDVIVTVTLRIDRATRND